MNFENTLALFRRDDEARKPIYPELMREEEASAYLGLPATALRGRRHRRTGPPYVKFGDRTIRYRRSDLDAWVQRVDFG